MGQRQHPLDDARVVEVEVPRGEDVGQAVADGHADHDEAVVDGEDLQQVVEQGRSGMVIRWCFER